jgi:hypothetical protein
MVAKLELLPLVLLAPPPPIVTVYVVPETMGVNVPVLKPPAPPPPPYRPPPPPPATTRYSTEETGANAGVTLLLGALAGPVPESLVAVTVKVYAVPVVSPVTVIGEVEPVAVIPPGLEVTVYPVIIAGMPGSAGAVNVTDADVLEATLAVPIVGAPGTTPAGPPRVDTAVEARKPIPKPLRTGMPKLI